MTAATLSEDLGVAARLETTPYVIVIDLLASLVLDSSYGLGGDTSSRRPVARDSG